MKLIERAIARALQAHAGQVDRYDRPYILHPLALMAAVEGEQAQMVAALHDVVEDSPLTLDDLRAEGFPEEVLEAVRLLTHDSESQSYDDYVRAIRPNALARQVKLADLRHNMDIRRMTVVTPEDAPRLEKYRRAWEILTSE